MNDVGKIIYVDGKLYQVVKSYEGDVDLSRHGSPWYEKFIEAVDPITGKVTKIGSCSTKWHDAESYIHYLESQLNKIQKVLNNSL